MIYLFNIIYLMLVFSLSVVILKASASKEDKISKSSTAKKTEKIKSDDNPK